MKKKQSDDIMKSRVRNEVFFTLGLPFPKKIKSGYFKGGHVQGIAVDEAKGFVYYSFTTVLLKTDFSGKIIGSVHGIVGHLGCISFDPDRRLLYGSLELKHDAIGKGISSLIGSSLPEEDAFYCVSFDCDKIDRINMHAEKDCVMKAVYLPDVFKDYSEKDEISQKPHRYGCSGIDGTAYGPEFGGSKKKIYIAYGIYSETERTDNDYQIILQFDPDIFNNYGKPLNQAAPHHSGAVCEKRFFFHTGNTTYGIQNLEYDDFTKTYMAAVYPGKKKEFENFPMFFIDAEKKAENKALVGRGNEKGLCLTPAKPHKSVTASGGANFPFGQTGMYSFGNGKYAFSHGETSSNKNGEFTCKIILYKFSKRNKAIFKKGLKK